MTEQGGRKRETVVVPREWGGRDAGKHYLITEMAAARAERWAWRMLTLLQSSGERVPDNVKGMGYVGVAILGLNIFLRGTIKAEAIDPLMDEMMTCVKIVRNPATPELATDLVSDDDVAEVRTRLWLRSEVLRLHTGFSAAEALSKLVSALTQPADDSSTA